MNKIDSLQAAIVAALPELANDPARLRMWIDRGAAQSRQTESLSFGFTYRLNILVLELASDIALLALAIFGWLRVNEPHLLAPDTDGFSFDADILDNRTADILIQIDVRQNVQVRAAEAGYSLEYLDEPDPLFPDMLGIVAGAPIPPLADVMTDTTADG
ncbi:phage tail protein [Sphingomonas psychrotolerans]|uniref:Phage tail protein n=1 Tax=Sphingomonas psychrotolerans TaxID=1327635 RepID=A0ABU3N113_9SPHN|nr:phage tail protein [Sphingomonas psychrotolerans]MDT8758232.1 phage tail protein [Sphingomonas psychrotolerans]